MIVGANVLSRIILPVIAEFRRADFIFREQLGICNQLGISTLQSISNHAKIRKITSDTFLRVNFRH